jgi:ribosomal protein L11 methyltransferase
MYLWRKLATPKWLWSSEEKLCARAGRRLVVVDRPGRESLALEVVCQSGREARQFARDFGGKSEKIPPDWRTRYTRAQRRPPMRIGRRLLIANARAARTGVAQLVIPAGVAFGTGEHATTAMSLRLLERVTRPLKDRWSFVDLGTGSGILALAARSFGAKAVVGIDHDPHAVSTARANARRNRSTQTRFQLADVRLWQPRGRIEVVAANLYSELLIETLPRVARYLASPGWIIASGIMRSQEREVLRALKASIFEVKEIRRRGQWIALSAVRRCL